MEVCVKCKKEGTFSKNQKKKPVGQRICLTCTSAQQSTTNTAKAPEVKAAASAGKAAASAGPKMCRFFKQGQCRAGASCRFSHEPAANPAAKVATKDEKKVVEVPKEVAQEPEVPTKKVQEQQKPQQKQPKEEKKETETPPQQQDPPKQQETQQKQEASPQKVSQSPVVAAAAVEAAPAEKATREKSKSKSRSKRKNSGSKKSPNSTSNNNSAAVITALSLMSDSNAAAMDSEEAISLLSKPADAPTTATQDVNQTAEKPKTADDSEVIPDSEKKEEKTEAALSPAAVEVTIPSNTTETTGLLAKEPEKEPDQNGSSGQGGQANGSTPAPAKEPAVPVPQNSGGCACCVVM